jgi:glycosyltransferase involved in cell wall biosynthesis
VRPLVSVVTAAHNAAKTLKASAESVLGQDYESLELIIVVNGCTDKTENIAQSLADRDDRVRVIHSEKGKVPSRNVGFTESRGEIIALNDADDVWLPGKLRVQVEEMEKGYTVVGSKIECVDASGQLTSDPILRPTSHNDIVESMLRGINPIANSAALFEKKLLFHIGTYDDCFPFCEDYHFWLRAIKFAKFKNVDKVLVRYFTHHSPGYDPQIPMALAAFYRSLYDYTGVHR